MAKLEKSMAFEILEELFRSIGNIERIKNNIKLSPEELKGEEEAREKIEKLMAKISDKYLKEPKKKDYEPCNYCGGTGKVGFGYDECPDCEGIGIQEVKD